MTIEAWFRIPSGQNQMARLTSLITFLTERVPGAIVLSYCSGDFQRVKITLKTEDSLAGWYLWERQIIQLEEFQYKLS